MKNLSQLTVGSNDALTSEQLVNIRGGKHKTKEKTKEKKKEKKIEKTK